VILTHIRKRQRSVVDSLRTVNWNESFFA